MLNTIKNIFKTNNKVTYFNILNFFKVLSKEVQDYKSQIENVRETAANLIDHGTLFQARLQPELLIINERWEKIYQSLQVRNSC